MFELLSLIHNFYTWYSGLNRAPREWRLLAVGHRWGGGSACVLLCKCYRAVCRPVEAQRMKLISWVKTRQAEKLRFLKCCTCGACLTRWSCLRTRSPDTIPGLYCGVLCVTLEVQFCQADSRGSASHLEMVDLLSRHRNVLTEGSLRLCASAGSICPRQFWPLNMSGAQAVCVCVCVCVLYKNLGRAWGRVAAAFSAGSSADRYLPPHCNSNGAVLVTCVGTWYVICFLFFFLHREAFLFRLFVSVLVHSKAFFVSGGYGEVHT